MLKAIKQKRKMKKTSLWENAPCINNDAIFIADSHFIGTDSTIPQNLALLECLQSLVQTPPSQVFLMGDIAHVLVGSLTSSLKANKPLLDTLNLLDKLTQIWWFEGNHDFCLSPLKNMLPNTHFIPRIHQPMAFHYEHKKALLAHGDIFLNFQYECYIRTLTSPIATSCLKLLDKISFGSLYDFIARGINRKSIRAGHTNLESFASKRIATYQNFLSRLTIENLKDGILNQASDTSDNSDAIPNIIIEGHFHLGQSIHSNKTIYISLPSFYVTGSIFKIESTIFKT